MLRLCRKSYFDLVLVFFAVLFLAGCKTFSPQFFGISASEWSSLDAAKRQEMRNLYVQEMAKRRLNAEALAEHSATKTSDDGFAPIKIRIFGGEAMMPPFVDWYFYRELNFTVLSGSCEEVVLHELDGNKWTTLTACYEHGVLFVDKDRDLQSTKKSTVSFCRSPLWEDGFIYSGFKTAGFVKFKNANIHIKEE